MAELRMITVGGKRPIYVPAGIRMTYLDHGNRENVVFVPNILRSAIMGEWEQQDIPILMLSTQTKPLSSGAPIEWRKKEDQVVHLLDASAAQERLEPNTLTAVDLLEWARLSRDPELPPQLTQVALNVLSWLGRPPMSPQQHAEWTRKTLEVVTEAVR